MVGHFADVKPVTFFLLLSSSSTARVYKRDRRKVEVFSKFIPGLIFQVLYALDKAYDAWKGSGIHATACVQGFELLKYSATVFDNWWTALESRSLGEEAGLSSLFEYLKSTGREEMLERHMFGEIDFQYSATDSLKSQNFLSLKLFLELVQNGDLEDMEERRVAQATALGSLECSWLGCTALPKQMNGVLKSKICSGCRAVRYCCLEYQKDRLEVS